MQTAKRRIRFLPLMERVCAGGFGEACGDRAIRVPRSIAIRINSDPIDLAAQASRLIQASVIAIDRH
jgi:hypothetical protein